MLNEKIQERKELIRLCCGTARGCPTLTRSEDGTFFIKDDYEGEVKLSVNELKQLAAFITDNDLDGLSTPHSTAIYVAPHSTAIDVA